MRGLSLRRSLQPFDPSSTRREVGTPPPEAPPDDVGVDPPSTHGVGWGGASRRGAVRAESSRRVGTQGLPPEFGVVEVPERLPPPAAPPRSGIGVGAGAERGDVVTGVGEGASRRAGGSYRGVGAGAGVEGRSRWTCGAAGAERGVGADRAAPPSPREGAGRETGALDPPPPDAPPR